MPPLHPSHHLLLPRIQIRHVSKSAQTGNTIPVKLLRDVPKFGPKGAIMAVARGRMRNQLFPFGQADYVPLRTAVSAEIDSSFIPVDAMASRSERRAAQLELLSPHKIVKELDALLPPKLQFRRAIVEGGGGDGTIHGSVGTRDVVEAVRILARGKLGEVKEEWVEGLQKIRKVGEYRVLFRVKGCPDVVRRKVLVVGG